MRSNFVFQEIWVGLRRNLTMTVALVVVVAISLSLLGTGLLFVKQVDSTRTYWQSKVEISVYLCYADRANPDCHGAVTTAQTLATLVKSARDIMRKDKGLNGDLDRLPMLTWIMFLKFLDDMEQIRETEAALRGEKFRPAIEPPYRWREFWRGGAGCARSTRAACRRA